MGDGAWGDNEIKQRGGGNNPTCILETAEKHNLHVKEKKDRNWGNRPIECQTRGRKLCV